MKFEAILFDCDGVLVDSEPITNGVLRDMLNEAGWAISHQECMDYFIGRTVRSATARIEAETGRPLTDAWMALFYERRNIALNERLLAIDAYAAPSRAAIILTGLGFDEAMQAQPLDSFSGGWKMRVALGALLFSAPDVLLLDEPSNHLDLEATLWLESFLKGYAGTLIVISHERDLLNNVVNAILHLQDGKLTLYPGGYDAFEVQRAERAAQLAAAKAAQDAQRARLQDYVARNSARASTAKQAQSRAKMLAKMQPIAALIEDPSLSFDFPSPEEMRPPLITLDLAAVGYGDTPVLQRLNLRIDPDDRIALLGRNGNGKTTLARLLAAQLKPEEGGMAVAGRLPHRLPGRIADDDPAMAGGPGIDRLAIGLKPGGGVGGIAQKRIFAVPQPAQAAGHQGTGVDADAHGEPQPVPTGEAANVNAPTQPSS